MPSAKSPHDVSILLLSIVFSVLVVVAEAKLVATTANHNATTNVRRLTSPWIKRVTDPRGPGCWNRPWVCDQGEDPPPKIKRLCCRNQCTEVSSDVNNCGLCGVRCPFSWQCCRGLCINTNINPFHCGRCDNKCPFRAFCFYGLCGYAEPLPPRPPFPFPPKPPLPPRPPFPFPPKPPLPPRPPFPFPPKPPLPPRPPFPFPPKPPQPLPPHPPFPFPPKPPQPLPPHPPFPFPPKPPQPQPDPHPPKPLPPPHQPKPLPPHGPWSPPSNTG